MEILGCIVVVLGGVDVVLGWIVVVLGWNSEVFWVSSSHRDSGSRRLCAFFGLPVSPYR